MAHRHGNISVFIPHLGCPNRCSFCCQNTVSSTKAPPSPEEAEEIIRGAYEQIRSPGDRADTEIAFFGGSFTAIDRDYMEALLKAAGKYLGKDGFGGIRISTRPDCVDREVLTLLKSYGVTAIELGAQSMSDRVLLMNERGHTSDDVRRASELIDSYGFELGLQMMTGLYGSAPEDDIYTAEEIVKCSPKTARIYPTAVLRGTRLAELYTAGEYRLYPFEECVRVCARICRLFGENGIRVIRMGLHAEDGVEKNAVAGFYHPSFGEIVRSEIIKGIIGENLSAAGETLCEAPPRLMSALCGYKKSNRIYFDGKNVVFSQNNDLPENVISVNGKNIRIY